MGLCVWGCGGCVGVCVCVCVFWGLSLFCFSSCMTVCLAFCLFVCLFVCFFFFYKFPVHLYTDLSGPCLFVFFLSVLLCNQVRFLLLLLLFLFCFCFCFCFLFFCTEIVSHLKKKKNLSAPTQVKCCVPKCDCLTVTHQSFWKYPLEFSRVI